jgi:ESS family glutamate:Na+ symporter
MSTGTTATGFVLLRMVDPDLDSGAAEDYALAAPLSAPFIGGGMLTVAFPLLLLERVPIAITSTTLAGLVIAMIFMGRRLFYKPGVPGD